MHSDCKHTQKKEVNPMKPDESLGDSTCADQIPLAERELASFIGAVRDLFGPEQALLSAEDWLDGYELKDSPLRFTGRDWRAVTVAASARLANRVTVARNHRTPAAPIDPKGSTMLSFDCLAPALCEKREESNHAF